MDGAFVFAEGFEEDGEGGAIFVCAVGEDGVGVVSDRGFVGVEAGWEGGDVVDA